MGWGGGVANERNVKWSHHMDIIDPDTSRDYLLINRILLLIAAMLASLSLWNVNNLSSSELCQTCLHTHNTFPPRQREEKVFILNHPDQSTAHDRIQDIPIYYDE